MAWKFRRRIRILPGFSINLSKTGMSATIGIRGASVNIGERGAYLNTGIPGTGIYDRQKIGGSTNKSFDNESNYENKLISEDSIEIRSLDADQLTSDNLFGLKTAIIESQKEKINLKEIYEKTKSQYYISKFLSILSYFLIFGLFYKKVHQVSSERKNDMLQAQNDYSTYSIKVDINMDEEIKNIFDEMKLSFKKLVSIHSIWDITSSQSVDRVKERSAASSSVQRTKTSFEEKSLDFLTISDAALVFHNKNGSDFFLFPGFIVAYESSNKSFGIIDYKDLHIESHYQKFIETESIPNDAETVGHTWKYVNKNGSQDKRFKDNYQIPIVQYYELNITTQNGINDSFQFSDAKVAEVFCLALSNYVSILKKLNWSME